MLSAYRVCFQPVLEGQDEETIEKPEEGLVQCVGVLAESFEHAIRKVRDEYEGTVLEWAKDYVEDEGAESARCEKCIILKAEHLCSIDIQ